MIFRLYESDGANTRSMVAEADLPHSSAALDWARARLGDRSDGQRYSIASEDGDFAAKFVRTAGGQWYAIAWH